MGQRSLASVSMVLVGYFLLSMFVGEVSCKGCNKTIRTTRAIRSPKLTRSNKNRPITCIYQFLGYGDKTSLNLFELNIRSFQVGRLVNETTCSNGYLQIVDHRLRTSSAGYICGKIRRSRTLLVETQAVSLIFHTDYFTRRTFFKAQSSVLPQPLARERHKELAAKNPGILLRGTYCDRIYINCVGFCDVMSPGYPGVYPRNVTCRYTVIYNNSDVKVTIGGQYFDKFDVWGAPGFTGHRIATYCSYDYIRIQDGIAEDSPVVGTFCGRGTLPRIILRNQAMVLELIASPAGSLLNDGFYLSVGSERRLQNNAGHLTGDVCQWTFNSSDKPRGYFYSLRHWYPPRTNCIYKFLGIPGERIWIHFQGFNIRRGDRCRDKLLIFDASWPDTSRLVGGFCGKTRPNETMLSREESLYIQFESIDGSYDGSQFEYSAYYMFVNSTPSRTAVPNTDCDQLFTSASSTRGSFDILPNRLQLRRRQVKCQVTFRGRPTEQVRISFDEIHFDPVKQCDLIEKQRCSETEVDPKDHLVIYDENHNLIDCHCSDPPKKTDIVSRGSTLRSVLHLYHIHYLAYRETSSFLFRGKYEFLQVGCGQGFLRGQQGVLDFPIYPDRLQNIIQCRWTIETSRGNHILLKFPRLVMPGNCSKAALKIYSIGQKLHYAELCDDVQDTEILPQYWNYSQPESNGHKIMIELTSFTKEVSFRIRWTEVGRRSHEDRCEYVCRDNITCLSNDLLCNGVINCPENSFPTDPLDESPSNCQGLELFVYYIPASVAIIVFLFATSCVFFCLWKKKASLTPRPK